jgi:hypothetical protein
VQLRIFKSLSSGIFYFAFKKVKNSFSFLISRHANYVYFLRRPKCNDPPGSLLARQKLALGACSNFLGARESCFLDYCMVSKYPSLGADPKCALLSVVLCPQPELRILAFMTTNDRRRTKDVIYIFFFSKMNTKVRVKWKGKTWLLLSKLKMILHHVTTALRRNECIFHVSSRLPSSSFVVFRPSFVVLCPSFFVCRPRLLVKLVQSCLDTLDYYS